MQTREERCEAIASLLPLLEIELYPEVDPSEGAGDACLGECCTCTIVCTNELWYVIQWKLQHAYPLRNLEWLLEQMTYVRWTWRWAVYYSYVQPWSDFDPERRQEWAALGVAWMAEQWEWLWPDAFIPTYVIPGMERAQTKAERIEDMLKRGFSQKRICRDLGCSFRDVVAVSRSRMVRPGSTA